MSAVSGAVRAAVAPTVVESHEDGCYEWLTFDVPCPAPLLPSAGVTVIITMDPDRIRRALAEVLRVLPTRHYAVLHNRGYRRCAKPAFVKNSALDLYHANAVAMAYSRAHYPGMDLLLLEDDCTWDPRVARSVLPAADRFLRRTPDAQHYFLGGLRIPLMSWGSRHLRVFELGGSHAVIHTPRGLSRPDLRGTSAPRSKLVDRLFAKYGVAYASRATPAHQTWPETANSKEWDNPVNRMILRTLHLDRRAQPGTRITNLLADMTTVYVMVSFVVVVSLVVASVVVFVR